MANEDMMVKRFKELGIKASAARAYMALVKIGPCSATRISQSSGVPQPRTYDVMNYLQEKGFVEVQKVGRRNVYKASKPDFALDRLMNEMRSKETYLRSSLRELENIGEASSPKIWVIKGRSNITAKAREIIDQSDIELLLAVSPDFLKRSMLASLRKAARRGVSISVILNASSDISPDELGELAELGTIRQRRVYRTTIVMGDYERALLLFHKRGNFEEEKYGLYTEDDGLLHIMDCHFCNFLWVPSEIVVKREAKERSFTHIWRAIEVIEALVEEDLEIRAKIKGVELKRGRETSVEGVVCGTTVKHPAPGQPPEYSVTLKNGQNETVTVGGRGAIVEDMTASRISLEVQD